MAHGTGNPADARGERNAGNIFERLDAARRVREHILDTPEPANDDRRTPRPMTTRTVFPTLKPPHQDMPDAAEERSWAWLVPWIIGAAILAVIFAFAVS